MLQEQEQRHVHYDRDLKIEAYQLNGIIQKFPNHFHDFYVTGFIERGKRHLRCKSQEHDVSTGDLLLFSPRDSHCYGPLDGEPLGYHAMNISPQMMEQFIKKITRKDFKPCFTQSMTYQSEIVRSVATLYDSILGHTTRFEKEETIFFFLEQVPQEYASPFDEEIVSRSNPQIQSLYAYMEEHFSGSISLDEPTKMTIFGKSYLLRSFTKQVNISPYRYLQTIHLGKAKHFPEQGIPSADAAAMTGFSDQSHLANFLKEFIGLTPRQYQKIFPDPSGPTKPEKEPCHEL